ncbi:MAG: hypothetical protein AAGK09_11160 [Planctomycetota bacterium]
MDAEGTRSTDLHLAQSRLKVQGSTLVRYDGQDRVIARHPFADIEDLQLSSRWQWAMLIIPALCVALAVLAKLFIPSEAWSWVAAVLLLFAAVFFVLMIPVRILRVKTAAVVVKYDLQGLPEEVDGFGGSVISLWAHAVRRRDGA